MLEKKSGHIIYQWVHSSYFLIWSSLAWSLLWAGFTLHTIFKLSSLFFFTMSRNKVWSFSYSSSHVVNTSKQATIIYKKLLRPQLYKLEVLYLTWNTILLLKLSALYPYFFKFFMSDVHQSSGSQYLENKINQKLLIHYSGHGKLQFKKICLHE